MTNGYMQQVLFVDLTSATTTEKRVSEEIYRDFIGGQGLGVRMLYEHMTPKADPLGPENVIGFVTSPLTGAGFHGARLQVVGKSPITGGWGDSNVGGLFALALKACGYDAIFITGCSAKPVYLLLKDGEVQFKNAERLWGQDTCQTEAGIKRELSDDKVRVVCIGPAGEKKSLSAAIMQDGSAAARSGLGAVMGAKGLKAVAVFGTKSAEPADAKRLARLRKEYRKDVRVSKHPWMPLFKGGGTCSFFEGYLKMGDCPIKNWTRFGEEAFPNWARLHGDSITHYQKKKKGCASCPLVCKGRLTIEKGPYTVKNSSKIEYETLGLFGSNLLIEDPEPLIKANDLCNRYGIDTCTAGSVIGFAMECYERGVITKEDTDGIEMVWGSAEALLAMIEKIGRREGFGEVLADGSKFAAQRIGQGSEEWAVHVGGQDLPAHDPRTSVGHGWGYICDPTPGRHTATQYIDSVDEDVASVMLPECKVVKANIYDYEAYAKVFATCSDLDRLSTSAGLCWFGTYPETLPLVEAMCAITGWDFTLAEGLKTGRRIQALRQAFNIREEVDTAEWVIPPRIDQPPPSGPIKGRNLDFKSIKRLGYESLGWDGQTGIPSPETLDSLGLTDLVGSLPS
ncbi:aldehyde ferredoxin oxidoreductase family protein [Desulforhopalus singaporensis]|uniref:Aldehyde:ferredoxin oxidoreductase n=1 Tax=Desulforhopalus singaporensis TaxID=91360 RepID=A0A1H0PSA4_9BACT|nr:aldehyde ferredoxin oxidoreductase family protein [Desulforhopalus singaporensis]SDP07983.1 aldehyde:ferredoxin oxidoreductase [Desulforhopalus singaporensis]